MHLKVEELKHYQIKATIGRDRFEKGQTKLVSEAMATLALKHTTCFERVD